MKNNQANKTETSSETKNKPMTKSLKKIWKPLVGVVVVLGIGGYIWQNPQIVQKWKSYLPQRNDYQKEENEQNVFLKQEISRVEQELRQLKSGVSMNSADIHRLSDMDFDTLNQKFETLEQTNLGIIKSKADATALLGIVNRLDRLEEKVTALARVTDESALVLTAAMLVKDSAERGGSFEYEAAILRELADNNLKIRTAVEEIEKISVTGIKSDCFLKHNYQEIAKNINKQQKLEYEKTWKDRVNHKLTEFIKVRRTNQKKTEFEENKEIKAIARFVQTDDFVVAFDRLNQQENAELVQKYPDLKQWMSDLKQKIEFNLALKKIINSSLAVMKVNSMKKGMNND